MAVCGLVAVISFGLAWLQDELLEKFVQQAAGKKGVVAVSVQARCIQPIPKGAAIAHAA